MKRVFLSFVLMLLCVVSHAQFPEFNLKARTVKSVGNIKADTDIVLKRFVYDYSLNYEGLMMYRYYLITDNGQIEVSQNLDKRIDFEINDLQSLWDYHIVVDVLPHLSNNGFQPGLREELREDTMGYINSLKEYNLILNDPILEDYIYRLLIKIAPRYLLDGRTENLNIIISQDHTPNLCCFSNGTIVVNIGLLSIINTEDELVAALAHEIAHFVLDHSVANINEAVARKNRAEFWGAVATFATAATEIYVSSQNPSYIPGIATAAVAAATESIIDYLGMNYNHEQEIAADNIAVDILEMTGYNKNALSTLLNKMKLYKLSYRDVAIYDSSDSHPSLVKRIGNAGNPYDVKDIQFEQRVSSAITSTALILYNIKLFERSNELVSRNIDNGVACAEDYYLKAACLLRLKDSVEDNQYILHLINKAIDCDPKRVAFIKTKIVVLNRLGEYEEAKKLLKEYNDAVANGLIDLGQEYRWAHNTLYKMNVMHQ